LGSGFGFAARFALGFAAVAVSGFVFAVVVFFFAVATRLSSGLPPFALYNEALRIAHHPEEPEPKTMSEEFYRMKRLPPYVIAEVNAMRAAARAAGEDIIDLGMGNPDLPPPDHVIEKLIEVARKPDAHGYSQSKGIPGLRRAQANYYGRRFGVDIDPDSEVVVTMGSKEGLASLATAITAPGDVVLAPNPSYPIHTFGFILAGATIRAVPTTPNEAYFESLERAIAFTVPRPSILVVNYPSNPTAETVDLAFYERLVAWA
jgi:alanine-synthesizing transaminase